VTFVDPSRNPLHDPDSGLYHGDVPVDPSVGPILRPADDEAAFEADTSSAMSATEYHPADAEPVADEAAYDEQTLEQLKGEARARGLSGYSTLSKAELVERLEADDAEHGAPAE
jgi:hypothetical protein